ncbi:hypothetical protein OKW38_006554 [Paraburkholderia sp. MM5496-R1]
MSPSREYWFPAKRYGWGWGLPLRWQGRLTLLAYFVLLGVVVFRFLELTRFRGHLSFGTGGVHRSRPGAHLHHSQRAPLDRPYSRAFERQPVDLILEYGREIAVAFRAAPNLPLRPLGQLAQFDDLRMICRDAIGERQAVRVEYPRLRSEMTEDALGFERQQPGYKTLLAATRKAAGCVADALKSSRVPACPRPVYRGE